MNAHIRNSGGNDGDPPDAWGDAWLNELYTKHRHRLLRHAAELVRTEFTEDLLHDAFSVFLRKGLQPIHFASGSAAECEGKAVAFIMRSMEWLCVPIHRAWQRSLRESVDPCEMSKLQAIQRESSRKCIADSIMSNLIRVLKDVSAWERWLTIENWISKRPDKSIAAEINQPGTVGHELSRTVSEEFPVSDAALRKRIQMLRQKFRELLFRIDPEEFRLFFGKDDDDAGPADGSAPVLS